MLSSTFAALADPTRLAIVARLASGPATVSDLAAPFAMTLPAVTKHLGVLERAGLMTRTKKGRTVRCELVQRPLREAADWLEFHQRLWGDSLEKLANLLESTAPADHPASARDRDADRLSP